jgi:hypothetical protein
MSGHITPARERAGTHNQIAQIPIDPTPCSVSPWQWSAPVRGLQHYRETGLIRGQSFRCFIEIIRGGVFRFEAGASFVLTNPPGTYTLPYKVIVYATGNPSAASDRL